jgi:hypothetical protein
MSSISISSEFRRFSHEKIIITIIQYAKITCRNINTWEHMVKIDQMYMKEDILFIIRNRF